jgi:hypothetical protein
VQGGAGVNPFNVASSTGVSLFTVLANGNVGIGSTTPAYNLGVAGTLGVTGNSTFATTTMTSLMFGTTSPFSMAKILLDTSVNNATAGATTSIAGIHGNFTFNPSAGGTQVGNRFVVNNAPTSVANTVAGEIVRTIDNTSLANTVRGIEVVSNAGSNTSGINTGIRTTGATFGVQAFTSGLGGGLSAPAAIYGENTGTTDGDILRLYTSTMTSSPYIAQIYQEISAYTGTALYMDLGAGGGSFTGNFVDFQKNDITQFLIDNNGKVGIGTSTLATTALTVAGDIRVGNSGTNGCLQGFGGATLTGTCTSDQRLKGNVTDITNVLDKIANLRVVNFNWNTTAFNVYGNDTTATQTGYIAQNVESIFPELIHTNKEGYKEVNYSALGLYAVEGVKELALKEASTTAALSKFSSTIDIRNAPTDNPSLTIDANGNTGIGTNHPLVMLHVTDPAATGTLARFENTSGYCDIDPTTKSLVCTTDDAQRANIYLVDSTSTTPVASTTATVASTTLEKVTSLNVVTYTIASSTHVGLMLSDVQALFPDLVKVDTNGTPSISLTNLIPYIVESVKSLALQIAELKNKIITHEVYAESLCVGTPDNKTCITKEKLDQLLLLQSNPTASASTGAQGSTNTTPSTTTTTGSTSGTSTSTTTDTTSTSTPTTSDATTTPVVTAPTPDTTAPVITVIGNTTETIAVDSTYTDAGATALDDVDGVTTVNTTGTVDTATAGTYTITYTSTDTAGNTSSVMRTVIVE